MGHLRQIAVVVPNRVMSQLGLESPVASAGDRYRLVNAAIRVAADIAAEEAKHGVAIPPTMPNPLPQHEIILAADPAGRSSSCGGLAIVSAESRRPTRLSRSSSASSTSTQAWLACGMAQFLKSEKSTSSASSITHGSPSAARSPECRRSNPSRPSESHRRMQARQLGCRGGY